MKIPTLKFMGRRMLVVALASALALLGWPPAAATAASLQDTSYLIQDGGQAIKFKIAADEIWVRESGQMQVRQVEAASSVSNAVERAEYVRQTTGVEANLVLYPEGDLRRDAHTRRYLTRSVLVKLDSNANAQTMATLVNASGVTPVSYAPGYWMLEVPGVGAALTAAEMLRNQSGVVYSEAQLARQMAKRLIPNDPLFPDQWHLLNSGQTGGTAGMDVNVTSVWDSYRGNDIVIGIVDDGLQITHPDLAPNVVAGLSYDWNGNDNDPSPDVAFDFHGTACAGCAAARGNNDLGVAGSAPEAGLAGLRLTAGPATDAQIAESMLHEAQAIQVKNNSWGPPDFGFIIGGPGPLSTAALQQSTLTGRGGLGTIHLWAGGNGLNNNDHANYDGYANSIYSIGVGACNDRGQQVYYSESGACLVIVAPSSDAGRPGITTTDLVETNGYSVTDYTATFGGTSAATPIAAGVVALLLESNPSLGWRDVQEILIRSATFVSPQDAGWFVNAAGLRFNNRYGAGLINAANAVQIAQSWVNLGMHTNVAAEATGLGLPIPDNNLEGVSYDFDFRQTGIRVEHATVTVTIQHPRRGDLEVELISPAGTRSVVAEPRRFDASANLNDWTFMSVQFWGENSAGVWKAVVRDRASGSVGTVNSLKLELHGSPGELVALSIATNYITGGNDNGIIDRNECNQFQVVLQNNGDLPATGVSVQLTTSTPGVAFGTKSSAYANIPAAGLGTNLVPFTISTSPGFICGTPIQLNVAIKSDQWTTTSSLVLPSGTNGVPRRFDNSVPVAIPDGDPAGVGSVIVVSNLTSAINKVSVSLHLAHARISDVTLELISPEGITNVLAKERGSTGEDYGVACSPESWRTTFDDNATIPIGSGFPPFLGDYRPESALSVYIGRSGTNLNGNWTLRVVDGAAGVTGTLQCWSLFITPAECVDGGGSCPGADLAIGMVDVPDPVFVGSNLVYHISVTNNGPGTARNVVVNHQLPSSVIFVSAVASQGSVVYAGGSVIGNLGILPLSGVATMTVTATATTVGTISSSASVTSLDPDGDTSDNNVTVTTRVNPPTTDLAISLTDAPDPGLVGSPLTYTVHVINNGPSTASGVTVTNLLPVSVVVQSASPSQGVANISGSVVVFQLGSLLPGGQATGTIKVIPTADGTLVATATVIGNQVDPVMANNTALTSTTIGPAADLAVSLTDMPDPVVLNSNLTYRITVTNLGPSLATGVVLNHALPAGVVLQSSNTTQGAITVSGNNVIGNLGSLVKNAGAVVTLVVRPTVAGTITANSSVTGSQTDPNSANNTALATTVVAGPFVSIQPAGATLTSESLTPPNGALDVGETVTVELRLRNSGNVHNTNLFATLLPLGGVAAPNPATPQAYGVLPPDGSPRSRTFAFTATGTNGGVVLATLQLQDGPNVLSNVVFAFSLPRTSSFQNSAQIVIPDAGAAAPYPSTLTVSGITGTVGRVSVTLSNLTHTYPSDVDVLLVGPLGQKVILMSAAGDRYGVTNVNLTFDDLAAEVVPGASPIFTGNYRPTAYNPSPAFPAPAPASPYGTALSGFAGSNPNGVWSLFVADHSVGDAGTILSGWSLAVDAISPVNRQADLSIVGVASPNPAVVDENLTWTFTITNLGPDTAGAVAFTNSLPAGLAVVSAVSSQGSCVVDGTQVVGNLGSLNAHSNATVVVVTTPAGPGFFTNVAKVASGEVDLNPANNTVAVTANGLLPVTDLALGQSAAPAPDVVVRSNVTFVVSVTNAGPGAALSTVLTNTLTAGANVVSVELSAGTYSIVGPQVVCSFGKLMPGDIATATIVAQPLVLGSFANTGVATTVSHDTDGSNNGATADVTVIAARPVIETAGAWVVAESRLPANGAIDPGETVTMTLGLKNTGQIGTSNLVATLLAGGGVVDPDGPKVYGSTAPDGGVGFGNFSFKAEATPQGVITATLNVSEGSLPLGTVTFIFDLVRTASYTNPTAIVIPNLGIAAPYPSVISVAGVTGQVTRATITLHGLSHSFPDDLDMMLVGPEGQRLVLMSDAGGSHAVTNLMLAFDDLANEFLPDTTRLATGVFKPANYETGDVFPAPAPPGPHSTQLAVFGGTDPNGDWSLYVVDDTLGDAGTIGGGWSLTLETAVPVTPLANLGLAASGAPANIFTGSDVTYALRVTNRGPTSASGIVVTQTLPAGAAFITASASQGGFVVNGGEVVFNAGALPVGAWAEFTVVAKLTVAGEASSAITLTANEADLDLSDNAATVMTSVVTPIPAELSGSYDSDTGLFWVTLNGQAGSTYVLQASENLVSWSPIATNTAPANGIIQFSDADAPSYSQRYYRAVQFAP